jgi:acyl-CoA thioester hydrolase
MSWPIEVPLPVQWGDMDALGHVNNAKYFVWFETARITLFEKIGLDNTGSFLKMGPILAKIECTFRLPLHYPDNVVATCRVASLGNTSFVLTHAVLKGDQVVAQGDGVIVLIAYDTGAKVPIPPEMRTALELLQ